MSQFPSGKEPRLVKPGGYLSEGGCLGARGTRAHESVGAAVEWEKWGGGHRLAGLRAEDVAVQRLTVLGAEGKENEYG